MKMQYLRQFPMVSHHPDLFLNAFYNALNVIASAFTADTAFIFAAAYSRLLSSPHSRCHNSGISPSFTIIAGSFGTRFQAPFHLR
jgi:hypothetical protein